ncbi:hypothetical protein PanWU01x14_268720 [Parasponia andersonii]|uniref:Uncharacterized protein n=1 Tax=Parasponia andersonii TaxID=3476 RepID=A0A2P5B5Y5_PARAD|nr:hypothetical protein PanWU01x14_268720 [Parasponia andersonii]
MMPDPECCSAGVKTQILQKLNTIALSPKSHSAGKLYATSSKKDICDLFRDAYVRPLPQETYRKGETRKHYKGNLQEEGNR